MRLPPGFHALTPYLVVDDAPRLLRFLVEGLGGEEVLRHLDGGRVAHAQVRIADSMVMLGDATPEWPARPVNLYLFVDDADAAMARALAAGGRSVMPVGDKPYGDRQGGVEDPCGNLWWLSQRLVDGPY